MSVSVCRSLECTDGCIRSARLTRRLVVLRLACGGLVQARSLPGRGSKEVACVGAAAQCTDGCQGAKPGASRRGECGRVVSSCTPASSPVAAPRRLRASVERRESLLVASWTRERACSHPRCHVATLLEPRPARERACPYRFAGPWSARTVVSGAPASRVVWWCCDLGVVSSCRPASSPVAAPRRLRASVERHGSLRLLLVSEPYCSHPRLEPRPARERACPYRFAGPSSARTVVSGAPASRVVWWCCDLRVVSSCTPAPSPVAAPRRLRASMERRGSLRLLMVSEPSCSHPRCHVATLLEPRPGRERACSHPPLFGAATGQEAGVSVSVRRSFECTDGCLGSEARGVAAS